MQIARALTAGFRAGIRPRLRDAPRRSPYSREPGLDHAGAHAPAGAQRSGPLPPQWSRKPLPAGSPGSEPSHPASSFFRLTNGSRRCLPRATLCAGSGASLDATSGTGCTRSTMSTRSPRSYESGSRRGQCVDLLDHQSWRGQPASFEARRGLRPRVPTLLSIGSRARTRLGIATVESSWSSPLSVRPRGNLIGNGVGATDGRAGPAVEEGVVP
jgi:hypothetical protein